MQKLNDQWQICGKDFQDFLSVTKDVQDRTHIKELRCENLALYTMTEEEANGFKFKIHYANSPVGEGNVPKERLYNGANSSEEVISTIQITKGAVGYKTITDEGRVRNIFLPYSDEHFILSLCQKLGLKGTALCKPSVQRDAFLASVLDDTKCKLIVRTDEGHRKVFSVRGKDYEPIPQNDIFLDIFKYIENNIGRYESKEWSVSNAFSTIVLRLPDVEEEIADMYPELGSNITPEILVSTSDIGLSSVCVWALFRTPHGYISPKKFRVYAEHKKSFSLEKTLEEVKKKVFANFASYPEAFAKLLTFDVNVGEAVDEAISHCGIGKTGLLKVSKAIAELVKNELGEDEVLPAYEVVMALIDAPERVVDNNGNKLPKTTLNMLAECFAGLPFCNFKKSYVLLPK